MLKTIFEDYPQFKKVLSMDEVGYGCGAGDMYITGVILDPEFSHSEVKDSKKLSEKKREKIYNELKNSDKLKSFTMIVPVEFINANGMVKSLNFGFSEVVKHFEGQYDAIFIDGSETRGIVTDKPMYEIVKGDNTYQNIACASVIAKVERDNYMTKMGEIYPDYDLGKNKGYLTPKHLNGLRTIGKCPIHRDQYVRNHIPNES